MSNVFNLVSEETYVEQTDKIAQFLAIIAAQGNRGFKPTSWEGVQAIVREGLADRVFSIGDQLTCQRDGVNLVWDIIGIDHDTPADSQFTHSMTLQLHDCFPTIMQFDAPEAFYYCETELPAGTYRFAIDSTYDATYNDLTSYQFTLTQAVPAGGQLTFPWRSNANASTIKVNSFANATSTTAIEQVAVSEGTDGTNLGTLNAAGDFSNNLNSIHRVRYGSNSYKESAIRQWLNSNAAAGSVWTPQNDFDRPPTISGDLAGFLNGMDADFLAVIGRTHIVTARNTVSDEGGYDETDDFFFLPSSKEVYFVDNPAEGVAYPYYSDFSDFSSPSGSADANRVKNKGTAAAVWWLRTQVQSTAHQVFRVMDDGRRSSDTALKNYYTAPVCNII